MERPPDGAQQQEQQEPQQGPAAADLDPAAGDDIVEAALKVLHTADPHLKAQRTNRIVEMWEQGLITPPCPGAVHSPAPDRPARDATKVKLVPSGQAPKRGKGGSLASRQALLHSLVHIENSAIDLAWDIIARFGADNTYRLPRAFFDDFVTVAADECRHFLLLEQRLEATGSHYGALAAHDGLWESAADTAGSLAARLAVEHCTHEARGLDVLPQTIHRFRSNGDTESADLLQDVVYEEEISHCAAGVRWLKHLHAVAHQQQESAGRQQEEQEQQQGEQQGDREQGEWQQQQGEQEERAQWAEEARQHSTVEQWFHSLIRRHFFGLLKPPFNDAARAKAGFGPEWYLPLAAPPADKSTPAAAAAAAVPATANGG